MRILIRGAGVVGLALAHELAGAGHAVAVADPAGEAGGGASRHAGGMLAPWCEGETAPAEVVSLGQEAIGWWESALPGHVTRRGTLVVAPARDGAELRRFAARTEGHSLLDGAGIAALEPDLAGRFSGGLFFAGEAHLDPRAALAALAEKLAGAGVPLVFGAEASALAGPSGGKGFDAVVDCTGASAIGTQTTLRPVRGEMLVLETRDIALLRPVRLLHPRIPLYVVPRGNGRFMVGATMIESGDDGPISARSAMELLNAAYALHPAFGEARVLETGTGLRPAYADNMPRLLRDGDTFSLNGFYRHGFLLAPAMARRAAREIGDRT
ncbi:glycine oxidase ThiO [Gellertiella hungarica]|uniref:Glycine oxidase n=1 Tax=Gellertiella hungarica TaxID=1572859 RepID=A0A7W6J751_9HYPH|nr:glycine oxidase ThiO [Gellertiella hungarica]MBB4066019.1 glycine oxidase [Gellertiella hungarica]